MYIKYKLSLFLLGFFLIILFFFGGSIYIFDKIQDNIELMKQVSEEHKIQESLKTSIVEFIMVAKNWAFTGQHKYKRHYSPRRQNVFKNFGKFDKYVKDRHTLRKAGEKFNDIDLTVKEILSYDDPVGNVDVLYTVRLLEDKEIDIIAAIGELESISIGYMATVSKRTETIKNRMEIYLLSLIVFSVLSAVLLIIILKKSISEPVNLMLTATDKVSGGNLGYRIPIWKNDEFGILSHRFNEMVQKVGESGKRLQEKLNETELLLDITKIAGAATDLPSAFKVITEIVAERLRKDGCAVYMLNPDGKSFRRTAVCSSCAESFNEFISEDDILSREAFAHLRPVFLNRDALHSTEAANTAEGGLLSVPVVIDGRIFGLIMALSVKEAELNQDELNLFVLISHTLGTAIKNMELHTATTNQLKRLASLYELAKTATSILTFEELFTKVASEMTRLLNARGCIIRLIDNDRLPVKSSYGLSLQTEKDMELKIGDGVAGWVAKSGKPLLVEDVMEMPEDMRVPVLEVKSVVCVPIKIADRIIGTIGIYDKKDEKGDIISFNFDDLSTAEGFASITSVVIEKTMIYEREREREKDALEAKKRMETLFESVRGGIITLDRNWTVLLANKYVETWIDKKLEDVIGKNSIEVFHDPANLICPHCVAKATFETSEINTITQSRGINYAELSSYPIKDEKGNVIEAVVFIQDITDRILYQEEILSLYKEVSQAKEYIESLIDNSADAIITTDLDGIITSWNKGAEKIYGHIEEEALGTFLPFVPEFLMETEKSYMERLKQGETIKDIETVRIRKDGAMFEVSLTLSPIKDSSGEVIGISGISRDISEKKKVEKELIRRNQELSRLFFISSAMRGTLELEKLLRMVLTAVTMSDGLGFNRAVLFLMDNEGKNLYGAMGVGPESAEEAWRIWDELSIDKKSLPELLNEVEAGPLKKDSFLDKLSIGMKIPLTQDTTLTRAVKEKKPINIPEADKETPPDAILIQQFGTRAYAVIPLIYRDKALGVMWVDNYFNRKPITDEDIRFLSGFTDQVATAIENARLFEQVTLAEAELENIFESISDMVYFNTKDYVIKSINKAVAKKIGRPPEEIIGKKCYEVFHGMDQPWEKCPHHKTVNTKRAFVEELEDPYLGGTFLTSSSPIFSPQDEFLGTVHVVRDVSELKKLREKLSMAERMAALGEVAAKVAHEIRNPLVSIGGFSRRLEKKLEGDLKNYASVITSEVTRLEGILKEILGYVRESRLIKEAISINAIIEDVLPLFQEEIRKKKLNINKALNDKAADVNVDANRIKEGLINVIGNAVEIVQENGEIRIRTFTEDGFTVAEISDSGPGIDKKDIPFVFDPFYTTKVTGTGLGLAITHKIIEKHNGKIEVESDAGKGAVFKIYLPVKEV